MKSNRPWCCTTGGLLYADTTSQTTEDIMDNPYRFTTLCKNCWYCGTIDTSREQATRQYNRHRGMPGHDPYILEDVALNAVWALPVSTPKEH